MVATTIWPSGVQTSTGFKDWAGAPPHLFGKWVGRPLQPWGFTDIYAETGLVIVRDDAFEGTVGVPYSFKTHNPGQVVSTFTLEQHGLLASINGTAINAVMNNLIPGANAHADYIIGDRCYYDTWRLRALNRHRDTGQLIGRVYAGSGVNASGVVLSTSSGAITTVYGSPPLYFFSIAVNVILPPGNIFAPYNFQVEVGFGGPAAAIASATTLTATPEWPAYTQSILTTTV